MKFIIIPSVLLAVGIAASLVNTYYPGFFAGKQERVNFSIKGFSKAEKDVLARRLSPNMMNQYFYIAGWLVLRTNQDVGPINDFYKQSCDRLLEAAVYADETGQPLRAYSDHYIIDRPK